MFAALPLAGADVRAVLGDRGSEADHETGDEEEDELGIHLQTSSSNSKRREKCHKNVVRTSFLFSVILWVPD